LTTAPCVTLGKSGHASECRTLERKERLS